jgi:hypothetical protein
MKTKLQKAVVFYGLHFASGVVRYPEMNPPFTILVNSDVAKEMDRTMAGAPVFLNHVKPGTELEEIQKGNDDGVVIESFFNQADGFHWAKFSVNTQEGLDAIKNGWTLSNCWEPQARDEAGLWHEVPYQKVAMNGNHRHLAIVDTPRYGESKILTPEEFKAYNEECEARLMALRNSKEGADQMFEFFKNKKEDVKLDANIMVTLPKSKKSINLQELLNSTDEQMEKNPDGYANPEHKVKLHDGHVCNVGQMIEYHKGMSEMANAEGFDEKHEALEVKTLGKTAKNAATENPQEKKTEVPPEPAEEVHNETEEEKAEKEKKEKEDKERVENARKKALALKNAGPKDQKYNPDTLVNRVVTTDEGISLGKKLF